MARPLRIQYPGAYYHVMNRGNRREDIFVTDQDRQVFLVALADSCETYHINSFEDVVHQSIIGAQDFVDWVKQKLPRKGQREVPSLKKLQHDMPVERIIAQSC